MHGGYGLVVEQKGTKFAKVRVASSLRSLRAPVSCLVVFVFGYGPIKRDLHADLSWNERKACRPRVIPGLSGSSWYLDRLSFSTRQFSGFRSLG